MKLDTKYFLNDEAVKWSIDKWQEGTWIAQRRAINNMELIIRAYGLKGIVTEEQVLQNLCPSQPAVAA